MSDLDLYKKRVANRGVTMIDRMAKDKESSFKTALERSYNSETITIDNGLKFQALLSDDKVNMDVDQKVFSVPNEAGFKIGDMFLWDRTNTRWLVYTQALTERAYFKGDVKKATHKIKWRNDNGVVFEQWACVRGPIETKIKEESKKHLNFEVPNNTLVLTMTQTEGTKSFKREGKLMLKDSTWQIAAIDDYTAPGIIELQLIEYYLDNEIDDVDENIAGGKLPINFTITSPLDTLTEVLIGSPIDSNFTILKNGINVTDIKDIVITTNSASDVIETDKIYLNTLGASTIKVSIASIAFEKEYTINVIDTLAADLITYTIEGSERVKCFGNQEYLIKKFSNGQEVSGDGTWSIDNTAIATIVTQTPDKITIALTGQMGSINLTYSASGMNTTKAIKVVSLFG